MQPFADNNSLTTQEHPNPSPSAHEVCDGSVRTTIIKEATKVMSEESMDGLRSSKTNVDTEYWKAKLDDALARLALLIDDEADPPPEFEQLQDIRNLYDEYDEVKEEVESIIQVGPQYGLRQHGNMDFDYSSFHTMWEKWRDKLIDVSDKFGRLSVRALVLVIDAGLEEYKQARANFDRHSEPVVMAQRTPPGYTDAAKYFEQILWIHNTLNFAFSAFRMLAGTTRKFRETGVGADMENLREYAQELKGKIYDWVEEEKIAVRKQRKAHDKLRLGDQNSLMNRYSDAVYVYENGQKRPRFTHFRYDPQYDESISEYLLEEERKFMDGILEKAQLPESSKNLFDHYVLFDEGQYKKYVEEAFELYFPDPIDWDVLVDNMMLIFMFGAPVLLGPMAAVAGLLAAWRGVNYALSPKLQLDENDIGGVAVRLTDKIWRAIFDERGVTIEAKYIWDSSKQRVTCKRDYGKHKQHLIGLMPVPVFCEQMRDDIYKEIAKNLNPTSWADSVLKETIKLVKEAVKFQSHFGRITK